MSILVTGAAGFIGFHICKRLLKDGISVIGYDNCNNYYDKNLKLDRINELKKVSKNKSSDFVILTSDIEDEKALENAFLGKNDKGEKVIKEKPNIVIHLAAQAGVRYSLENPKSYIKSNLEGFANILESSRKNNIQHLVYASSSSVYGGNKKMPFNEDQSVDHPISLYAASKKANELMAHSYSHLFNIPVTGLRFFTVYGPWGRPDMALFKFTKNIVENKQIEIYNYGKMMRDFTYIDDIVESIIRVSNKPPTSNNQFDRNNPMPSSSWAPYRVFNIGNSSPVSLLDYIDCIEKELCIKAKRELLPIQPGDVEATSADTSKLENWIKYKPKTSISEGIKQFIKWFKDYYSV